MSLIIKIASRNLLQDRLRFVATVVGIVFSIVLVNIQMGLFLSFERMVTTMIDHAPADLWIVPLGTKCFEDPSLLDEHDRVQALSVPGVTQAIPVVIGFTQWTVPERRHDTGFHCGFEREWRGTCIPGISSKAISLRSPPPTRLRSTRPISDGSGSRGSAKPPKSVTERRA